MPLLEDAVSKVSDLTLDGASSVPKIPELIVNRCYVPKIEGSDSKIILIGSLAFAAGIATSVVGYFLWKEVTKSKDNSVRQQDQLSTHDLRELFDPEYVLPEGAEWWKIVEEEERRNPNFGKNVSIASLFRLDPESDLSTDDGIVDDDDDDDADDESDGCDF